jgi:WD40 repeat protein
MQSSIQTKRLMIVFVCLAALVAVGAVWAVETPILEIDTGGHKALIKDIMFTADGHYLVSASDDKTVRVWDVSTALNTGVATGETVRVLRGEIGAGQEGMIYAAALSPDNRLLAVGGMFGKGRSASKPWLKPSTRNRLLISGS